MGSERTNTERQMGLHLVPSPVRHIEQREQREGRKERGLRPLIGLFNKTLKVFSAGILILLLFSCACFGKRRAWVLTHIRNRDARFLGFRCFGRSKCTYVECIGA